MAELAFMKVKIGTKKNGHANYPNFNALQCVIDSGMDWAYYIDVKGLGWCYDSCGHKESEVDSPIGIQWGCLCVPQEFVDQAAATFSDECEELIESEYEEFHQDKAYVKQPSQILNNDILNGIKLKQDLGLPLTQQQTDALDPDNDEPGITENKDKVWKNVKAKKGVTNKKKKRDNDGDVVDDLSMRKDKENL